MAKYYISAEVTLKIFTKCYVTTRSRRATSKPRGGGCGWEEAARPRGAAGELGTTWRHNASAQCADGTRQP